MKGCFASSESAASNPFIRLLIVQGFWMPLDLTYSLALARLSPPSVDSKEWAEQPSKATRIKAICPLPLI